MANYFLYMHGGSFNGGCEAIVRSTCKILDNKKENITLYSNNPKEDIHRKINLLCDVKANKSYKKYSLKHLLAVLIRKTTGNLYFYYENLVAGSNSGTVAI
jgi:colanic acid/amylovoran biosynthesis protein